MDYIIVDLEMHPVDKKNREIRAVCKSEIIEIGAIRMDEELKELDSFKSYVKPQYSSDIRGNIERLTGISWNNVRYAPYFEEAMDTFICWCMDGAEDFLMVEWSDNDHRQMLREAALKDYDDRSSFLADGRWYDFQPEFAKAVGMEQLTSLTDAVVFTGGDFAGKQHDALADARNTAGLFRIVREPGRLKKSLDDINNVLSKKPSEATMGDLFNFESLGFCSGSS